MNNRGQIGIIVVLFSILLATIFLIALIPAFTNQVDSGTSYSTGLNCAGSADYNSTLGERSAIGCIGIKLFIPFLVLGVLLVFVMKLFGSANQTPQQSYQPYQG